ncbi:MAG: hypothetical protein ACFBSE_08515 [Prochloraceae cyanobacterium]
MKSPTPSPLDRSSGHTHRRFSQKLFVSEITIKLLVNSVLIAVGVSTLVKLLPEYFSQEAKLREIKLTVERTETRVDRARAKFNANFDPQRTMTVIEEQTPSIGEGQLPIFWLKEKPTVKN